MGAVTVFDLLENLSPTGTDIRMRSKLRLRPDIINIIRNRKLDADIRANRVNVLLQRLDDFVQVLFRYQLCVHVLDPRRIGELNITILDAGDKSPTLFEYRQGQNFILNTEKSAIH